MYWSGLFDTILLEVLLVRSVPCRLGISSDMALSCCLSLENLQEKIWIFKQLNTDHEKLKATWEIGSRIPQRDREVYLHDYDKQACAQTLPEAAGEASSCACKGLDAAPGSACTSSSLSSGSGHVLAALCTGCPHGPGGVLLKGCEIKLVLMQIKGQNSIHWILNCYFNPYLMNLGIIFTFFCFPSYQLWAHFPSISGWVKSPATALPQHAIREEVRKPGGFISK